MHREIELQRRRADREVVGGEEPAFGPQPSLVLASALRTEVVPFAALVLEQKIRRYVLGGEPHVTGAWGDQQLTDIERVRLGQFQVEVLSAGLEHGEGAWDGSRSQHLSLIHI